MLGSPLSSIHMVYLHGHSSVTVHKLIECVHTHGVSQAQPTFPIDLHGSFLADILTSSQRGHLFEVSMLDIFKPQEDLCVNS